MPVSEQQDYVLEDLGENSLVDSYHTQCLEVGGEVAP